MIRSKKGLGILLIFSCRTFEAWGDRRKGVRALHKGIGFYVVQLTGSGISYKIRIYKKPSNKLSNIDDEKMSFPFQVSTVGFYQLSKICITPAVLALNTVVSKQLPTSKEILSVVILCVGVALATISDGDMSTNVAGISVAIAAITFTAIYQVFILHAPNRAVLCLKLAHEF